MRCLSGEGAEKDEKKASEWHQKAALKGEPRAQYSPSHMYEVGVGVKKDAKKSDEWLEKAARNGHMEAKRTLTAREDAD